MNTEMKGTSKSRDLGLRRFDIQQGLNNKYSYQDNGSKICTLYS